MSVLELKTRIHQSDLRLISSRIRKARRSADLSLDKLAERVGTSRQHLINLEKARHRPRLDMLSKIAEATGRQVEWFLDPDAEPSPFQEAAA